MASERLKILNPTKKIKNSSIYFYYYTCNPLAELNMPMMQSRDNNAAY